jgi:hypothetical protein
MAKRRNKLEIEADKIIKAKLNILGEKIYQEAVRTSRFDTGLLRGTQNYRVQPDTVLTMAQVHYGKYNYPDGVNSGPRNALLIAINKYLPDTVTVIIDEMTDQLTEPFKTKK